MHTRTWHVEIYLYENDDSTRAEAVLRTDAGTELRHQGIARRNPADRNVPEVGDELAACRAVTGLAHDLLEATLIDVAALDPEHSPAAISVE
ncbi:DUF1876 domain-containing protein [Nocardioides sp. AN3]